MSAMQHPSEFWRARLRVPNYGVSDASRFADVSSATIRNWQKLGNRPSPLSHREKGKGLSYLQLIELAVVASVRDAGVKLPVIRETREYMSRILGSEFPFAEHRFKTDGRHLWIDFIEAGGIAGDGKLLKASGRGQLAWAEIIGKLREFEYDKDAGLAVRWHLAGEDSAVVIDPRVQFGKPSVKGIPTWLLAERAKSGDSIEYLARDYGIPESAIADALAFEGFEGNAMKTWSH